FDAALSALRHSDFLHVQLMRIETTFLQARCLLAAADMQNADRVRLAAADRCAAKRESERSAWASALATLVRASSARMGGDQKRAPTLLGGAGERLQQCDMGLHAAVARYRLGAVQEAATWMRARGLTNPEAVANLHAPVLR